MKKTKRLFIIMLSVLVLFSVIILPANAYDTSWFWDNLDVIPTDAPFSQPDRFVSSFFVAKHYYDDYTKTYYIFRNTENEEEFLNSEYNCLPGVYFEERQPGNEVPNDVKRVVIASGVNGIRYSFNDLPYLESVEIADSVGSIMSSFNNCPNLRKVTTSIKVPYDKDTNFKFQDENFNTGTQTVFYGYKGTSYEKLANDKGFTFIAYPEEVDKISLTNVVNGVKISWQPKENFSEYRIYRGTKGTSLSYIGATKDCSFVDKTAKNNNGYYYAVRPYLESGIHYYDDKTSYNYSTYSDDVAVKSSDKITYLASPVIKSIDNSTSGATIKWGKVAGATSYYVYRKTTGGWTRIATTKSTSFTDKTAKSGVEYRYTLRAVKSGAVSAAGYSKENVFYKTPTLKSLTAAKGKNTLTFSAVNEADFYVVYRKTNGGAWERLSKITSTTYIDKDIVKGKTYTYTVRASDGTFRSYYNTKGLSVIAK